MWPFTRKAKATGPTTENLQTGGWEVLWGTSKQGAGRSPAWESMGNKEFERAPHENALVHSCLQTIGRAFAEARLEIGYWGDGSFEPLGDHEMLRLVREPNQYYDHDLFRMYRVTRYLLTGQYFVWKWRNGRHVRELWPVPTSWVKLKKGRKGNELLQGYQMPTVSEGLIPLEDMVRAYYPAPGSMIDALSPMDAVSDEYQLDQERKDLFAEQLVNMDVPGLVVSLPETISNPESERIRRRLEDRIGRQRRGNTLVLRGDNAKAELMHALKDMDWPGFTGLTETRLAMAWGISTLVIGARVGLKESPYANYKEARRAFYRDTMIPLWSMDASALTRGLLQQEGESRLVFRYNTENIPDLQEDQSDRAKRARDLFEGGVITRNQARVMIGEEEVPGGDVYRVPINVSELSAGGEGEGNA